MKRKYIIGIDLGGTNLRIALLDSSYLIKDKHVLDTRAFREKESLILAITDAVKGILEKHSLEKKDVLGIGLGLPGPIDTKRGLVHFFPNIAGWKEVGLKKILEGRLELPVFLDNDANLMALAEYTLGAAKGLRNVVCITLGTGVGGGIIIEGRLYRGSSFAAGEVGHMPLNEKGAQCNCGGIGCLESYIGNNKILEQARLKFKKDITLEEVSRLAKKRNRLAMDIWYNVATHLGIALSSIINLLNPDGIVIGGGVANAGKVLFDKVRAVVSKRAMSVQARHVKILKAQLGNDAGIIGAAVLVRESLGKG